MDNSSLANALAWVEATLHGAAATAVAVLAIAGIGLWMMWGYVDWRRGARVVIGCFILFSAPVIADAILNISGPDLASSEPAAELPVSSQLPYEPSRQPRTVCWDCGAN